MGWISIPLFKKRQSCDHEWHKTVQRVETYTTSIGGFIDTDDYEATYIYCPKCKTRRSISPKDWELIEAEQLVQRRYDGVSTK